MGVGEVSEAGGWKWRAGSSPQKINRPPAVLVVGCEPHVAGSQPCNRKPLLPLRIGYCRARR